MTNPSPQAETASPPILTTKLFIPPPRTDVIIRPRLLEQLDEGQHRKLTLVSAPAGFGKTTLISAWLADYRQRNPNIRAAWLALDERDNDLARFLTYFIEALRTSAVSLGRTLLPLLHSPQNPPTEALLVALLNEIAQLPDRFILILDDYHLADSHAVDEALTFLIEHLPQQMHLIITTREDPDLPLARLRTRRQLTEIRARELRFSLSEAGQFLRQGMGLDLSAEDISALEDRTEGWIAGLHLAALSMQGQADVHDFIRDFTGAHHYIVDYLVDEVLERQPEALRRFLLQTAILERFTAPLCAAVTGQEDSQAQLEALERGNFFIVPLDDKRRWYRYHHLFADVLAAHLKAEQPDQVAMLHRRASVWYEQNDLLSEAIHHALTAQDYPQAASLIERALPMMRRSRQESTILGWLRALPEKFFRNRPVLSIHYAGALLQSGLLEGAEPLLNNAERWLEIMATDPADAALAQMIVSNKEDFRLLAGMVAMYRAAIAQFQGNPAETMKYARRIPDLVREDDHLIRGAGAGLLALAYWTSGDLDSAYRWYSECMTRLEKVGYLSDALGSALALADIRIAQGHLSEAMGLYQRGLRLATQETFVLRGTADMHIGISMLLYEKDDLIAAAEHLEQSQALGEYAGLPQSRYRYRVAQARMAQGRGDLDGALALLDEAEALYFGDFFPNVQPVAALKARLHLAQGSLDEAAAWLHQRGLSTEDDLSYVHEFEHITLARILLSRYQHDRQEGALLEAVSFLERLLTAAENGSRARSVIEILILKALTAQMRGDVTGALIPFRRALEAAEPEHYHRLFTDEGPHVRSLLEEAARRGIMPAYTAALLKSAAVPSTALRQKAVDALSDREMDVLRLLATDLSGPEIAHELMISLNTLRTHTRNIFSKLGATNRRAAVHRAEDLHLL